MKALQPKLNIISGFLLPKVLCSYSKFLFKILIILGGVVSFPVLANATVNKGAVLDRVVAVVNDEAIPESALNRQMQLLMMRIQQGDMTPPPQDQLRKQLLDKMILEKLQLQRAKEASIEVEENELNNTIADIAKRDNLSINDLKKSLEDQGVSFTQFRDTIKNELTILKLHHRELGQNINISATEIDQFLQSPAAQDQSNAEYHLGHILIPLPETPSEKVDHEAKKQAEELVQQLKNGADFSQIAIGKSSGAQALNGGDLGWRKAPELPTIFSKVAPTLRIGSIHGPIRDSSGYHIIKLIDKRIEGVQAATTIAVKKCHVRQIFIKPSAKISESDAEALLNKIREEVVEGADFSKLAQKHSHEANSAAKGGDLGWLSRESVVPEFYKSMTSLQKGELSKPFKTALGWHLIQLIDARQEHVASEALRNKAKDILTQRKMDERLGTWLRRLRDDSQVEIHLNES